MSKTLRGVVSRIRTGAVDLQSTGVMFSLGPNSIVAVTIAAVLIHLKDCSGVAGISLAPVFWNLTNPM